MSLLEVRDHASRAGGLEPLKAGADARAVRSGKSQPLGRDTTSPFPSNNGIRPNRAQIQDGRSPEREEFIPYSLSS